MFYQVHNSVVKLTPFGSSERKTHAKELTVNHTTRAMHNSRRTSDDFALRSHVVQNKFWTKSATSVIVMWIPSTAYYDLFAWRSLTTGTIFLPVFMSTSYSLFFGTPSPSMRSNRNHYFPVLARGVLAASISMYVRAYRNSIVKCTTMIPTAVPWSLVSSKHFFVWDKMLRQFGNNVLPSFFFLFFFILRLMGKSKALAHHTSTYFHTRRVSI